MKIHLRQLVLMLFVVFATTMHAQEVDTIRFQNEINRLNDIIESKDKEIKQLHTELDVYRNAPTKLKDCRDEIDVLSDSISDLKNTIKNDVVVIDELRKVIDELSSNQKKMNPLVKRQLVEMSSTVDQNWLGKSFSDIDKDVLQEELQLYEAFKDEKGVGEAYNTLKAFGEDCFLYFRGVEAVNTEYQADKVASLINPIKELKNREIHNGRKAELEQLYDQLIYYQVTVEYCQGVIGEVDNLLASFKNDGTEKSAWKQIRMFIDDKDEGQVESSINMIPWLGAQFQEYLKQLQANPYAANTARETIMNIVP